MPPEDLTKKRAEAQTALAGSEWTAKHAQEEKAKTLKAEEAVIAGKISELGKQKEKLELTWIELDNQRRTIRLILNPLLDEEKKKEVEEAGLEAEEAKIGLAADKQVAEKKRAAVQLARQEIEKKKWVEEDKLAKIETTIQANTLKYRGLLDEEEKLEKRLTELKLDLATNAPHA